MTSQLTFAPDAAAATLTVIQDGTGDFTNIFDAVEAAASGDTVRIRAGVYSDIRLISPFGDPFRTHAYAVQDELTIIGDGAANTIIESPGPDGSGTNSYGIVAPFGRMTVLGVTVRGMSSRGIDSSGTQLTVRDCVLEHCDIGVDFTGTESLVLTESTMRDCNIGAIVFRARGAQAAFLENCTFQRSLTVGVELQSLVNSVDTCDFLGNRVGMTVPAQTRAFVTECRVAGNYQSGFDVNPGGQIDVRRCVFESDNDVSLEIGGGANVEENIFLGGVYATIALYILNDLPVTMHNNHILNSGGWSVFTERRLPPQVDVDMRFNYWGTIDGNQILDWMYTRLDDPGNQWMQVNFLPIANQPVDASVGSFGDLKTRFHSGAGEN